MPTPALLDIDALTAEIPGGPAAGQPLPHGIRTSLESSRPRQDADEDEARQADWASVRKLALDTLANTSKDLLVAARLTEAETYLHGFAGLRDGLRLLTALVDRAWDRMYPEIGEDHDADVRLGPITWLNDKMRASKLPHVVSLTALVSADGRSFNFYDWQDANRRPDCEVILQAADRKDVQITVEDLRECFQALKDLTAILDRDDRLAGNAPGLASTDNPTNLGQSVFNCMKLAEEFLERKGGFQEGEPAVNDKKIGADDKPKPTVAAANDRASLYRQLEQTAAALRRIEPHSPIPFLIQRAVKLGQLEFPELMKKIIREETALGEIARLLGLEEQT
jgi:type VI secretion system protein ImpA